MEGIVDDNIENAATLQAGEAFIDDPDFSQIYAEEQQLRRKKPRSLRNNELSYGFDLDYSTDPCTVVKSRWDQHYDIGLFGRLGVHCYNLQKGTNFKFVRSEKYSILSTAYTDFYVTLEAMDPAINSVFSFQTLLSDYGCANSISLKCWTFASRLKCNKPVDDHWDDTSIDDFYRGPLPKWFSDHELASDPKRFYEVQESDLPENDWLQLFSEIAFFSKAECRLKAPPGLDIKKIVIETKEEYTTEAREKLKADNAIFYISYKCTGDESSRRGLAGDHKSVLRKTMDGKPGHICIEVAGENENIGNESPPQAGGALIDDPDEFARICDLEPKQSKEVHDRRAVCDDDNSHSFVNGFRDINHDEWRMFYDIDLCGRLGLHCYNFQKGTNYDFEYVSHLYTPCSTMFFITTEAVNPDNNDSPFTLQTWVKHDKLTQTVQSSWETCFCDVKGSQEAQDHEWDNEAIDDRYKGEMPKWLSDDHLQHCYVVKNSELDDYDNWWLHLFAEFAFYTKWFGPFGPDDIAECRPLDIQKVVVETRGEAETEPREKLKAANAIFYISFWCRKHPETDEEANYRAVLRKTMDGKPGHMRLEVICWST